MWGHNSVIMVSYGVRAIVCDCEWISSLFIYRRTLLTANVFRIFSVWAVSASLISYGFSSGHQQNHITISMITLLLAMLVMYTVLYCCILLGIKLLLLIQTTSSILMSIKCRTLWILINMGSVHRFFYPAAQSHYPNECWFVVILTLNKPWNWKKNTRVLIIKPHPKCPL